MLPQDRDCLVIEELQADFLQNAQGGVVNGLDLVLAQNGHRRIRIAQATEWLLRHPTALFALCTPLR
jgi:hypothetical protein